VITVRPGTYAPANIAFKAGVPTTLIFRSDGAEGCVRALVMPDLNRQVILPWTATHPLTSASLRPADSNSCAMGMYSGTITAN